MIDSDGDGFEDDDELAHGTSSTDASDYPRYDFSNKVDEVISESSGLDSVEANLKVWLDASNIDGLSNDTLTNGDTIELWEDLSGNNNNAYSVGAPSLGSNQMVFSGDDFFYIPDGSPEIDAYQIYVVIKPDLANQTEKGVIIGRPSTYKPYENFGLHILGSDEGNKVQQSFDTGSGLTAITVDTAENVLEDQQNNLISYSNSTSEAITYISTDHSVHQ